MSRHAVVVDGIVTCCDEPDAYVVLQGRVLGRDGRVVVERIGTAIWVGGACLTVLDGTDKF